MKSSTFSDFRVYACVCAKLVVSTGVIVLLGCVYLFGQSNTGRILGSISDQSGAVIPGASVTVTNVQTGVERILISNEAGEYVAPNSIPGIYKVRVEVPGFVTVERQNILLETGRDIRVDVQLNPGEIAQTVEVTAAVPLIDSTSVTIGGTLSNQTINDVPLNGRNYQNLLILLPGVLIRPGGGSLTKTTNGLRPEDQNYLIDGLDSNEAFSGESITNSTLPSGDAATLLPIDAIQEFNTEVNGPAEFGRKPGAVVNVGVKSGTNALHGTAYAFGRNGSWGARNFFNPAPGIKSPLEFEQFGGSAGGPIVKSKVFYFGAFEEQRYTVGNASARDILSTAPGAGPVGSVPDAIAALQQRCAAGVVFKACSGGTFTVNPLSQALLPYFGTNTGTRLTVSGYGFPNVVMINNAVGKVEYHVNSHHAFNGSYYFGNGTSTSEDSPRTLGIFRSVGRLQAQFVTSNWTWTPSSSWVNVVRAGWTYYNRPVFTFDHNTPPTAYGINTGVTNPILFGMPAITVTGLNPQVGPPTNWPNNRGPNQNYDFVDQVSYLVGRHAFKFGGEFLHSTVTNASYNFGRGSFTFTGGQAISGPNASTGLQDFLAGVPRQVKVLVGDPLRHVSQEMYAGFIQDAWRVTPKVTLNLGLHYDYNTPIKERNNLIGNWSPAAGLQQVGTNISSPYHGYRKDLAPHAGVAWDVTGKGTTILRAGGSLVFDDIPVTEFIYHNFSTSSAGGMTYDPTGNALVLPDGTVRPPLNPKGGAAIIATVIPGSSLNWVNSTVQVLPTSLTTGFSCGNGLPVDPTKAVDPVTNPLNPPPCDVLAANPNLPNPHVGTWTLSLQHAFANNVSLEIAYVGNHAGNLTGIVDVNQPPAGSGGAGCTLPAASKNGANCEQVARPYYGKYPYLHIINYLDGIDRSNYNGLQTTFTTRNFHNLSLVLGYSFSHALDQLSGYFSQQNPQDSTRPSAEYASADSDIRHHFTLSTTYNLPGKKSWGQVLEGWQFNSIVHLQSGLPWTALDTGSDISQTGELRDHWNFFGNAKDFTSGRQNILAGIPYYKGGAANMPNACTNAVANNPGLQSSLQQFGCYSQGSSALIAPPLGTFGTASRNMFRGHAFRNWDLSVFKIWKLKEQYSAQFRAEFFNVLNHPNFFSPPGTLLGGNFGCLCTTPDVGATNPTLGSGGPRAMEFGLKLGF